MKCYFSMDDLLFPLRSVFLALPLEQEAKWQFQALQEELKPFENVLRFQNSHTPHLTLQFWNEVMEIEYHRIEDQAQKIAAKAQPFLLQCTGASTFGSRGQEKVLFLDVAFSEELASLKKQCPWPNARPFSPHITLARIGHPQRFAVHRKKIFKTLDGCSFSMSFDRLRLYAEVGGEKQTSIAEFPFQGSTNTKTQRR